MSRGCFPLKGLKVAVAGLICVMMFTAILYLTLSSGNGLFFPLQEDRNGEMVKLKNGGTVNPELTLSGYWINHSWFFTGETMELVLEDDFTNPETVNITRNSTNQSVAMSFNVSSLGDVEIDFTGVKLYVWRNGTDHINLTVQLRNAALHDGRLVPNATLLQKWYSYDTFSTTPGWVTLLNESPYTLNVSDTYEGIFFIVLFMNESSDTSWYVWNATRDEGGVNSGIVSFNTYTSLDDLNNVSMWDSSDGYDCWMNVTLMTYPGLSFEFPVGWELDSLTVDIANDTSLGSVSYELTGQNGSFTFNVSGDRVYSANFSFGNVSPEAVWHVLEGEMNSGGYARCVGSMGEAQMFLLGRMADGVNISIPVANFGAEVDLVAELRNATLIDGRWVPGSEVLRSVKISRTSVGASYSWITINFTVQLSPGRYFLVLHTDGWQPSSGYYDWGSHVEGLNEGPPDEGYELWTLNKGESWVTDVRDPYGNRYWHCMKIAPDYPEWDVLKELMVTVDGALLRKDGTWNGSVWLSVPSSGEVTVPVSAIAAQTYDVNCTARYVNYTGNLSSYSLYINDTMITSMIGGGYTVTYSGSSIGYNKTEGKVHLVVKLNDGSDWVSENLTVFAFAKLSFHGSPTISGASIEYDYTHNGTEVSFEQECFSLIYPADYTVKKVEVNGSDEQNWLDRAVNESARELIILKNESIGELGDGDKLELNVTLLPELNVTHGFGYVGEKLNVTVGNLLDLPDNVNVTVIYPNGTANYFSGSPSPTYNFSFSFTPYATGKYILKASTESEAASYSRNFTSGRTYIFYVHELTAYFIIPTQENWTSGRTYTVSIWVGYTPSLDSKEFNGTVNLMVNGTVQEVSYNSNTGFYTSSITPRGPGKLNLTVTATDNEGHVMQPKCIIVNISPPETPSSTSFLTVNLAAFTARYAKMNSINVHVSILFLALTSMLTVLNYVKPSFARRIMYVLQRTLGKKG